MANISPKLFQKAIQQGIKTALFTTSTAALMLSSSGALGGATIDANTNFTVGAGLNPAGPFGGGVLQYGNDAVTVDADAAVNISTIDVHGFAPGLFTVNENISLGTVELGGGTAFPVSISDTFTLTLTGEDGLGFGADIYTGLGAITLNGATAGLTINSGPLDLITLGWTIDGGAAGQGVLRVSTDTTFTAAVGATKSLASITVDAGVTVNATTLAATNIVVNGGEVVATGAVNGAINLAAGGTLFNAGGLVTGTAVFNDNGKLTLGNGISADITAAGDGINGTVVVGNGNIQNVGANGNSLVLVQFNNTAASTAGNIFATNVKVNSATANVVTGTVNGAINFADDGALTANGGITGAVTTANNNTGKLIIGAGDVTGAIGVNGGDILNQVTFNGASNVTTIDATNVTINNGAADVKAAGAITAAVNFAADGALTANNGITGAVAAAGGVTVH